MSNCLITIDETNLLEQNKQFVEHSTKLDEGGRSLMTCGHLETANDGIVGVCIGGPEGTTGRWSDKTWLYQNRTGEGVGPQISQTKLAFALIKQAFLVMFSWHFEMLWLVSYNK